MHRLTSGQTASRGFERSALVLSALIAVVALALLPYAMRHSGSASPAGVAAAAAISLVSAWASAGMGFIFGRTGTPLVGLLMGMAARMAPPLIICVVLASQGADGRRHLAFICYLLCFYLVALAAETCLAVKRVHYTTPDLNHGTR